MTLTFLENQKFYVVFGGYKYGGLGDNGLLSIVEWYSDRKSAVWVWINVEAMKINEFWKSP